MKSVKGQSLSDYLYELLVRFTPMIVMGLLALASFLFLKSNTKEESYPQARAKQHVPDYVFENAKLTILNELGNTKMRLIGKSFTHFEDDASMDIVKPQLRLFSEKVPATTVMANTGQINGDLSVLQLFDQAEISRPNQMGQNGEIINPNMRAISSYFKVLITDDVVDTNRPVKIEKGSSVMTANEGAHFENIDQKIVLFGSVKGMIVPGQNRQ